MQTAVDQIYRLQSQGYRHDYQERLQLLDIDTDGRPCGKKAAFATKGYFARRPNRRGRQEGYVLATWYTEVVVKRLFSGTTQLNVALQPLIEAAETSLYTCPVHRIAVRCPKQNGQWAIGVIVSALSPEQVLALTDQPAERSQDPRAVLLAYVYFYDLRWVGWRPRLKRISRAWGHPTAISSALPGNRWWGNWKCWPIIFSFGLAPGWHRSARRSPSSACCAWSAMRFRSVGWSFSIRKRLCNRLSSTRPIHWPKSYKSASLLSSPRSTSPLFWAKFR
jgi:hypothetical protein